MATAQVKGDGVQQATGGDAAPTGSITHFAGSTVPDGWLECDGSAISRTTFSDLFNEIGTTWGVGDGSTTFNLPDLRGRFIHGEGSGRSVGDLAGEESHQLTVNEIPSHSHSFGQDIDFPNANMPDNGPDGDGLGVIHLHATGFSTQEPWGDTGSTGGDTAHNNMQPFLAMKTIIKT